MACLANTRWPTVDGLSCQYLKDGKCLIKTGEQPIPTKASPTWPNKSSHEVFQETCVDWPQNSPEGRDTGGCCWQWVED
jgi:hypothetical protein